MKLNYCFLRFLLILAVSTVLFASCEKNKFDYPIDRLVGEWTSYEEFENGEWGYSFYPGLVCTVSFFEDGSFVRDNGIVGTYKTNGKIITTYVDGNEDCRYEVLGFGSNVMHVKMYCGSSQAEQCLNGIRELKFSKPGYIIIHSLDEETLDPIPNVMVTVRDGHCYLEEKKSDNNGICRIKYPIPHDMEIYGCLLVDADHNGYRCGELSVQLSAGNTVEHTLIIQKAVRYY